MPIICFRTALLRIQVQWYLFLECMHSCIRWDCFTNMILYSCAGKGWYNLNESNYETYCFSKMKSLLVVTRFMMEDTLRSLVLDNHSKYVAFVNAACSAKVLVLVRAVYCCLS